MMLMGALSTIAHLMNSAESGPSHMQLFHVYLAIFVAFSGLIAILQRWSYRSCLGRSLTSPPPNMAPPLALLVMGYMFTLHQQSSCRVYEKQIGPALATTDWRDARDQKSQEPPGEEAED